MNGQPRFSLVDYIQGIRDGWPETDVQRWIVCGLARDFHVRSAAEQQEALAERVPLTGTKWDALLAAMVEHVARLHGHEPPAWVDGARTVPRQHVGPVTAAVDPDALVDVRAGRVPATRGGTGPAGSGRARGRTA